MNKAVVELTTCFSCHSIHHASSNTRAENGTSVIRELCQKLLSILMNYLLINLFASVYWSTFNSDSKILITMLWQ